MAGGAAPWRLVCLTLVVALVLPTACSSGDERTTSTTSRLPATTTATTSPQASTTAAVGALTATNGIATVQIDPSAISAPDASLTVAARPVPVDVVAELGEAITVLGDGVDVRLDGATLVGTATVSFQLPDDFDPLRHTPAVLWESSEGGWEMLESSWAPGDTEVVATTDHFSWGFGISIDWSWFTDGFVRWIGDLVTGRAGADNPTCGDEQAARDAGVDVVSDYGDLVKWCYGVEDGRTVLKVTNNWRAGTQVQFPKTWNVASYQGAGVQLQAIGDWLDSVSRETDTTRSRLLGAGQTIVLEPVGLTPGVTATVRADPSTVSWLFSIALTAASLYVTVAGKIGRFGEEVLDGADFTKCFTEYYGDDADVIHNLTQPVEPDSLFDTLTDATRFGLDCGEDVLREALTTRGGLLGKIGSAVVGVIAAAIGVVYGLINAAFAGIRILIDQIAELLQGPDVGSYGYDIILAAHDPPIRLDPVFPYVIDHIDLAARTMTVRQVTNYFDYQWDNWIYSTPTTVRIATDFYVARVISNSRVLDTAAFASFENARQEAEPDEIVYLGTEDSDPATISHIAHFLDGGDGEGVDWDYCSSIGRGPDPLSGEMQESC